LPNLPAGHTTFQVTVQTPGTVGAQFNLTASIARDTPDLTPDDNTHIVSASSTLVPGADLQLTVDQPPNNVGLNGKVSVVYHIHNNGPTQANGIVITAPLSGNLGFNAGNSPGWGLQGGTGLPVAELGSLAPGGDLTTTLVVIGNAEGGGGFISKLSSSTPDPNPNNNLVGTELQVGNLPNIALTVLNLDTTSGNIGYIYAVKDVSLYQDTEVKLYWATGPTRADVIQPAIYQGPVDRHIGTHGPFFAAVSSLSAPPDVATYLVAIADPDGKVVESSLSDNLVAVKLPLAPTFSVSAPAQVYPGRPFQITVTARNRLGLPDPNYTGVVTLTSSDPSAVLPKPFTLTTQGVVPGIILNDLGSQSLYVSDKPSGGTRSATFVVTVSPVLIVNSVGDEDSLVTIRPRSRLR